MRLKDGNFFQPAEIHHAISQAQLWCHSAKKSGNRI
jgi:hypothetical protein